MAVQFENLQSTLAAIIKAMSQFTGYTFPQGDNLAAHVLIDDGTIRDASEDALKSTGWVITISPPIVPRTISQTCASSDTQANKGIAKLEAVCVVSLRTNPKLNTGPITNYMSRPEQVPLFQTVRLIAKAVLSWIPGQGEDGFMLIPEHPCGPDFQDIGAFTYDIRFSKSVPV